MMGEAKVQFASPEWVTLLQETLTRLHADARPYLVGADFTICEVFTDVPPDGSTCVWAARITQDAVTYFEAPPKADFLVRGDYEAILPGAKLIYQGATEADLTAQAAHRERMVAAGRISSTGDIMSAPRGVRRMLQTMHDILARQSL